MDNGLKDKILYLRKLGKNYNEIKKLLNCSKGTISYHCRNSNLGGDSKKISGELVEEIQKFYNENTLEETAKKFNISKTTVTKYTENKRTLLSEEDKVGKNYFYVKSYRQRMKLKSIEYKGGKCEICGYNSCPRVFDFHHKDPKEKDFTIGSYNNLSWEKIKIELDKCILLCANCHRELHYKIDNKI